MKLIVRQVVNYLQDLKSDDYIIYTALENLHTRLFPIESRDILSSAYLKDNTKNSESKMFL